MLTDSGREDEIRNVIREKISSRADEVYTDTLGNLIAVKKGSGKGKRIMLAAHMDEIGWWLLILMKKDLSAFQTLAGLTRMWPQDSG
nr:hypothetical protein [Thermoclostridium stercorarium]